MSACVDCGANLGFARRLSGATRCQSCEGKVKAAKVAAAADYANTLKAVMVSPDRQGSAVARMREAERAIAAGGGDFQVQKAAVFRAYAEQMLADEILSASEEGQLHQVANAFFDTQEVAGQVLAPLRSQLFVAMVNDGRLPETTSANIMLKKNEVLHVEEHAALLKEVVQREFRGGSHGMSFRIAKGVSYRVGAFRGQMVEVGRSWQAEDEGLLFVTSQRLVFTGIRRSVEMPYAKLLNLSVFTDALQVHVSNRQKPTTIRVPNGNMIAAAVNAAMQRELP